MAKKLCWAVILLSILVNVVMLQWTVESYFGKEYEHVYLYTIIAMVSGLIAFSTYFGWRKLEQQESK